MSKIQRGLRYFPFKDIVLSPKTSQDAPKDMRIIQLSDLHLHPKVSHAYLHSLVAKINKRTPDLVLLTGDIIECSATKLTKELAIFKNIKAPAYYVTGNHDIFYGKKALQEILEKNSIISLDNRHICIEIRGELVQLVGISDRYSFLRGDKRPIKALFSTLDKNLFTILLAHQPKDIEYIKDARVDIQLSGHTHGGQIFPLSTLVKLFQPYFAGVYTKNNTLLYVTTGLGYWGIALRYRAKSEIPVFTLSLAS